MFHSLANKRIFKKSYSWVRTKKGKELDDCQRATLAQTCSQWGPIQASSSPQKREGGPQFQWPKWLLDSGHMVAFFLSLCCRPLIRSYHQVERAVGVVGTVSPRILTGAWGSEPSLQASQAPGSPSPSCSPPSPTKAPAQDGAQNGFFFTSVLQSPPQLW